MYQFRAFLNNRFQRQSLADTAKMFWPFNALPVLFQFAILLHFMPLLEKVALTVPFVFHFPAL